MCRPRGGWPENMPAGLHPTGTSRRAVPFLPFAPGVLCGGVLLGVGICFCRPPLARLSFSRSACRSGIGQGSAASHIRKLE